MSAMSTTSGRVIDPRLRRLEAVQAQDEEDARDLAIHSNRPLEVPSGRDR